MTASESPQLLKTQDHAVFQHIPVTRQQILNCAFSSWYNKYKTHVPKSKIIKPLPKEFIDYLTSDGIVLPDQDVSQDDFDWGSDEEDEVKLKEVEDVSDSDSDSDDEEEALPKKTFNELLPNFQEIHNTILSTLEEWGALTPKLNWSAPRDATWIITGNSMKCTNVTDLYLLLNASNYVMYDIDRAFEGTEIHDPAKSKEAKEVEFELVLRKWVNVNPALEFRCFVKGRKLVGISQRDLNYYDFLDALKGTFHDLILEFFETVLKDTFEDSDFVFDVYIPRPFNKVFLIDINPFSRTTDPQLYTWHELASSDSSAFNQDEDLELRLVTQMNKGRFYSKEHSENQMPRDIVDASLDSNAMAELAREWRGLQMKMGVDDDGKNNKDETKK